MMTEPMTSRQRWLAALDCRPVDRLPFWPNIAGGYVPAQQGPFNGMTPREIHEWIGSDQHEFMHDGAREVRTNTSRSEERDGDLLRAIYHTPHGEMILVEQWDAPSMSWHPIQHPVTDQATIRLMTEFYEDEAWELDAAAHEQAQAWQRDVGERALVAAGIGESPLMHFIEYLAGIENAHYFLSDYREDVEALFTAMHSSLLRKTHVAAAHSTADAFYFVENTSSTLISPQQYRDYCLPHLRACTEVMQAAGKRVILHMCGHLKKLLPDIGTLPVAAFEAFTSPTLGNTTLLDGRMACPDICLAGGTNATLWTRPHTEIIAQLTRDLNDLPHHRGLVITSAGVMPPLASPETIKAVCDWVKEYPARM